MMKISSRSLLIQPFHTLQIIYRDFDIPYPPALSREQIESDHHHSLLQFLFLNFAFTFRILFITFLFPISSLDIIIVSFRRSALSHSRSLTITHREWQRRVLRVEQSQGMGGVRLSVCLCDYACVRIYVCM